MLWEGESNTNADFNIPFSFLVANVMIDTVICALPYHVDVIDLSILSIYVLYSL